MTKARKKREWDQWDDLLDSIDFKGLTREVALDQEGLIYKSVWINFSRIFCIASAERPIPDRYSRMPPCSFAI
jgi:hypothetical protein